LKEQEQEDGNWYIAFTSIEIVQENIQWLNWFFDFPLQIKEN